MASYLNELLSRVAALQIEAMASINVSADAKPYFYHTNEGFPYFTNRVADGLVGDTGSQEFDANSPLVIMRLVVAHLTEGYKGEPEYRLYEWLPVVKSYIQERSEWLQSAAYPARFENLQSARIVNGGGFRALENTGINSVVQVCGEIQLACIFPEYIDQAFY